MSASFGSFIGECRRVLTITRKPTKQEYRDLVKICGLGLLLIGFTGFLISTAATYLKIWLG